MSCNASGHSSEYCWEPGGGDVGGKKYHASRAKAHIATDLVPTHNTTIMTTLLEQHQNQQAQWHTQQ